MCRTTHPSGIALFPVRPLRIGFLGPEGTFTEEALLRESDYADGDIVPMDSLADVLESVDRAQVDLGFVPLENAIEGTVRDIIDSLVFDFDLRIQREVVLDVHLHLMGTPGTSLGDIERVASIPVATAQCLRVPARAAAPGRRWWPPTRLPSAARLLGEGDPSDDGPTDRGHRHPGWRPKLYGLEILAEDVEDHPDNQTRFVSLAKTGIPSRTGHDRTSIACFQNADHPGSLYAILGQFAARSINLTKLESRPTKQALGDYCFIIDFEGHVGDAVVADCLADLHAELAGVKFLGSYPAAGPHGEAIREEVDQSRREAHSWMEGATGRDRIPVGVLYGAVCRKRAMPDRNPPGADQIRRGLTRR